MAQMVSRPAGGSPRWPQASPRRPGLALALLAALCRAEVTNTSNGGIGSAPIGALAAPSPACFANAGCDGLPGDCCPASDGMMLACCGSSDPLPPPGPPAGPPPPVPTAPPGPPAYRNIYDGNNPMQIRVAPSRGDNYFLILGDWGRAGGPGSCQANVAARMKDYVRGQAAAGKKLLFVAAVGDNFYWSGITPAAWDLQWANVYGSNDPSSPLHDVPWLAVLGNHDYGNNDPFAACPSVSPKATVQGQPYGCGQFNADKNPERPPHTNKFWLPDYNYHYEIPEASLEVIALDTNARFLGSLGGEARGREESINKCGGVSKVSTFLQGVLDAGNRLLSERAQQGTAKTVLIIQHYPGACGKDFFEANLPESRRGQVEVVCAYGHIHDQTCEGNNQRGACNMILSGGGGGCCAPVVSTAGFAAVGLTEDGVFNTEMVNLPPGCAWRRRLQVQNNGAPLHLNATNFV